MLLKLYYNIIGLISDVKIEPGSSDFRLLDRKVVNYIKDIEESQLFLRGIISWIGFKYISIPYIAQERFGGSPKYTLKKMFRFAIDGIMSSSTKPLRLAFYIGGIISMISFLYIIYALYMNIIMNATIEGWTSILISVLFIGGIQLLSIGLIGEYIGRIFIENKKRKAYVIQQKL